MKDSLVLISMVLATTSCGSGDSTGDMSVDSDVAPDLVSALDLYGTTGCKGVISCMNACPPLDGTCFINCLGNATPNGMTLYRSTFSCSQRYCVTIGQCAWADAQMTMVMPVPGNPNANCDDCMHDARAYLFGYSCRAPASAECKETQCVQTFDACLNDLP